MLSKRFYRALVFPLSLMILFTAAILPFYVTRVSASPNVGLQVGIENYIRQVMKDNRIPGLSLGIVEKDAVIYTNGFGLASIKKGTLVSAKTIFDLASCSKSFTALAVLLLWHDGFIDIDKPFKHYVPEFKLVSNNEANIITIRQLLNQTSGIPGTFSEPVAYHQGTDAMRDLVAAVQKVSVNRPPGTSFEYTNLNYALLGALVERVSGETFEDYVKEHIFKPLGMNNSTLSPEVAKRLDRADGHQLFLGKVVTRNVPVYRSMAPAGWVMSSAEDMCRWLELNLNDGILDGIQAMPSDIIRLMHSTEVAITKAGETAGYAMGWFTDTTDDGTPVLWHGGDTPNFLAEMIMLPEQNIGVIMLVNGQTCTSAHQIAQTVISMVSNHNIVLPSAPWWASWKSTDDFSIYASILSILSLLTLGIYVWWQFRHINRRGINLKMTVRPSRRKKIWLFILPATPWAILLLPVTTAFIIMQMLFGVNIFGTLIRVGYFTPPSAIIAAILILFTLFLWALATSLFTIFKALGKNRAIEV
jgi:putative pyoverdin transport system ATP-binding/permease protein